MQHFSVPNVSLIMFVFTYYVYYLQVVKKTIILLYNVILVNANWIVIMYAIKKDLLRPLLNLKPHQIRTGSLRAMLNIIIPFSEFQSFSLYLQSEAQCASSEHMTFKKARFLTLSLTPNLKDKTTPTNELQSSRDIQCTLSAFCGQVHPLSLRQI